MPSAIVDGVVVPARIVARVFRSYDIDPATGCWIWRGVLRNGYAYEQWGSHKLGTRGTKGVHRITYTLAKGPIPDGLEMDHLCRVPACINPDHVEPVTHQENMRRGNGWSGRKARQTHCVRGHEFTPENTAYTTDGKRRCRECRRQANVEHYQREKAGKTHCERGHLYTPETTMHFADGQRVCAICQRIKLEKSAKARAGGIPQRVRVYCKHGHPMSGDNLRVRPNGERICITCRRKTGREWARRQAQRT